MPFPRFELADIRPARGKVPPSPLLPSGASVFRGLIASAALGGRGGQRCACADSYRSGWGACCPCRCTNRAEVVNCGVGSASYWRWVPGRTSPPADSLSCEQLGKQTRLTYGQCRVVRDYACVWVPARNRTKWNGSIPMEVIHLPAHQSCREFATCVDP